MIIAYNQEQYIRQAIEGALSQTYQPLEIILSDDCSGDGTYEIIQEIAGEYSGPHQIRTNRNEHNLGIGGHVSRLMEMAGGELIVVAAGDDVSLPERVERMCQEYRDSGGTAMSIYSSFTVIDEHGKEQGIVRKPPRKDGDDVESRIRAISACGCSHSWHRSVFDIFGPMLPGTVYEDKTIAFRSAMLGEIRYVDEPLVLYRRHPENITAVPQDKCMTGKSVNAYMVQKLKRRLLTMKNYQRDLSLPGHQSDSSRLRRNDREEFGVFIRRQICLLELKIAFAEGKLRDRVNVIWRGIVAGVALPTIVKWCICLVYPYDLIRTRKKLRSKKAVC